MDQQIPTNYVPLASAYAIAFCWSNKHQQNHVALPSALDMVLSVSLLFTLEGSTAYLDHPYMHDSWRHLVAHCYDTPKNCNDNPHFEFIMCPCIAITIVTKICFITFNCIETRISPGSSFIVEHELYLHLSHCPSGCKSYSPIMYSCKHGRRF